MEGKFTFHLARKACYLFRGRGVKKELKFSTLYTNDIVELLFSTSVLYTM
jgi:hypothetical protein